MDARDMVLAAAIAVVLFGAGLADPAPHNASPAVLAALSVAVAAPLALRRRLPLTVAITTAAIAALAMSVPGWSGRLVALAALGSAAYHRPQRIGALLVVSAATYLPFAVLTRLPPGATAALTHLVLYLIAPVAIGFALRLHRDRADQLARTHRAEERLRIARELHDSVGHHLTAIRMQARAARHVLTGTPIAGRALDTVDNSAAAALGEVRSLLDVLRDPPGAALSDVDTLAEHLSTPARSIAVRRTGSTRPLPATVDHGGFRLVQEALTNAVRHSGADRIEVLIRHSPNEITICVTDNGPTSPPAGPPAEGSGIRGMRERARSLGGSLGIAPRRPHGWEVRAVLPVAAP